MGKPILEFEIDLSLFNLNCISKDDGYFKEVGESDKVLKSYRKSYLQYSILITD
jgi:hypothetical protein